MGVTGGLLTLDAFNSQFPRMDTIHTHGAQNKENSQMQGRWPSDKLLPLSNRILFFFPQALSSPSIPSEVSLAPYHASTLVTSGVDVR